MKGCVWRRLPSRLPGAAVAHRLQSAVNRVPRVPSCPIGHGAPLQSAGYSTVPNTRALSKNLSKKAATEGVDTSRGSVDRTSKNTNDNPAQKSALLAALKAGNVAYAWELYCARAKANNLDGLTQKEHAELLIALQKAHALRPGQRAAEMGRIYENMRTLEMRIPATVYLALVGVHARLGDIDEAVRYHTLFIQDKFAPLATMYALLMHMYAANGRSDEVSRLLREMQLKNIVVDAEFNNRLLQSYLLMKDSAQAERLWAEIEQTVDWDNLEKARDGAVVAAACEAGLALARFKKDIVLAKSLHFHLLQRTGSIPPMLCRMLLQAAAAVDDPPFLSAVWKDLQRELGAAMNSDTIAVAIRGFAHGGELAKADEAFRYRPHPEFSPRSAMYAAMMQAYALESDKEAVVETFAACLRARQAALPSMFAALADVLGPKPQVKALFDSCGLKLTARSCVSLMEAYLRKRETLPLSIEMILAEYQAAVAGARDVELTNSINVQLFRALVYSDELDRAEKLAEAVLQPSGALKSHQVVPLMVGYALRGNLVRVRALLAEWFGEPVGSVASETAEKSGRVAPSDRARAFLATLNAYAVAAVTRPEMINGESISALAALLDRIQFALSGSQSDAAGNTPWHSRASRAFLGSFERARSILQQYQHNPDAAIVVDISDLSVRTFDLGNSFDDLQQGAPDGQLG